MTITDYASYIFPYSKAYVALGGTMFSRVLRASYEGLAWQSGGVVVKKAWMNTVVESVE